MQILEEAGFAKHGRIAVTQPRRVVGMHTVFMDLLTRLNMHVMLLNWNIGPVWPSRHIVPYKMTCKHCCQQVVHTHGQRVCEVVVLLVKVC